MSEQIITLHTAENLRGSFIDNISTLYQFFERYISEADHLRTISILLILLAIALFLLLIVTLYIKSLFSYFRDSERQAAKHAEKEFDEDIKLFIDEHERELELERELARELEMARAEKDAEEKELQKQLKQKEKLKEDLANEQKKAKERKRSKKEEKAITEQTEVIRSIPAKKDFQLDFDWKKGKIPSEAATGQIEPEKLQYKQSKKTLAELTGLIIDMLARGVDDYKIAQTIMFRNQAQNSEDDVLQTIDEIKNFIGLAVDGKLARICKEKNLPDEATALYQLALGDTTPALSILEAQMDDNIERASTLPAGAKREEIFARTSQIACTFGTLAAVHDTHLATGAFELSIEMAPQNINAWSRAADMYFRAGSINRAMNAYQNVLNLADEEMNINLIANANKMMSQVYYEQGNNLQAANFYNNSRQYYDSLGINRRLDRQEVEVVEIIESHQRDEIGDTINKILAAKNSRQYAQA